MKDTFFEEAKINVVKTGCVSLYNLMKRFRIGYSRASRIMTQLEEGGIVSELNNGKREVIIKR
tara:strand:+ start:256 stop:444 length:189 start_codon:yes stop_codon:yes gene_type:complete